MKRPIFSPLLSLFILVSFSCYLWFWQVQRFRHFHQDQSSTVSSFGDFKRQSSLAFALKTHQLRIKQSERSWQRSVEKRHKALEGKQLSDVPDWEPLRGMYFWDYFTPSFTCPYDVERVGRIGDGGKWICGFNTRFTNDSVDTSRVKQNCVVYSIGVRDDSSFEEEIIDRTSCEIFAYDFSVSSMASERMQKEPRVKFQSLGIGSSDNERFKTLASLMKLNLHTWIDIFKIDVEGSEYEVLDQIMQDFPDGFPFGQMLIEFHLKDDELNLQKFLPLWERLEKHGLRPFWTETNHNPCVYSKKKPIAVEYSFLNIRAKEFRIQTQQ